MDVLFYKDTLHLGKYVTRCSNIKYSQANKP